MRCVRNAADADNNNKDILFRNRQKIKEIKRKV